jgi:hypothetical protein
MIRSLLRGIGLRLRQCGNLLLNYCGDEPGDVDRDNEAHADFMLHLPGRAGLVSNRPLGAEREVHEPVVHVDRYRRVDEGLTLVTWVEDFDPSDLVICHLDFPPIGPRLWTGFGRLDDLRAFDKPASEQLGAAA